MIEIGRICVKIAGRDAGKRCVIIDILDNNFVLIDGETRRRRCNVIHLEPTKETVKVGKEAAHEAVTEALGIEQKTTKRKSAGERPKKKRKTDEAPAQKKPVKAKKADKPKEKNVDEPILKGKKEENKIPKKTAQKKSAEK